MANSYTKNFEIIRSVVRFERTADGSVALSLSLAMEPQTFVFTPEEWREVERALQIAK